MKDKNINIEALKNTLLILGLLFFLGGGGWFLFSSSEQAQDLYNYYFWGLFAITVGFKMGNSEPYTRTRIQSPKEIVTLRQIRDRTCLFLAIIFLVILNLKVLNN
jgi:hypothetical protein